VCGASNADSVDFDVPTLAKTAASEPILIEPTDGADERGTGLVDSVVDLISAALAAVSVDEVVSEGANAGLLFG
jgi:hypothetical protein